LSRVIYIIAKGNRFIHQSINCSWSETTRYPLHHYTLDPTPSHANEKRQRQSTTDISIFPREL